MCHQIHALMLVCAITIMKKNTSYRNIEQALNDSFASLLLHTLPESISVMSLVRMSGINRTTFYNHYPDGMPQFLATQEESFAQRVLHILRQMTLQKDLSEINEYKDLVQYVLSVPVEQLRLLSKCEFVIASLDYTEECLVNECRRNRKEETPEEFSLLSVEIRALWGSAVELIYQLVLQYCDASESSAIRGKISAIALSISKHIFP